MIYVIFVTDARGGSRIEYCHVASNPEAVAEGLRRKTYTLNRRQYRTYSRVEIVKVAERQSC